MMKKIRSARQHKKRWWKNPPPREHRVLILNAIRVAGNAPALAKMLGITRSSVYQWMPPYRLSPYMPEKMARRFLEDPVNREELSKLSE